MNWPATWQLNSWLKSRPASRGKDPFGLFTRFPVWMWNNPEFREFCEWLRHHNAGLEEKHKTGIYGMDIYSMYTSIEAVLKYLKKLDPEAAERARERYACFDHFGEDGNQYARQSALELDASCQKEVVDQLLDLQQQAVKFLKRDGFLAEDEQFFAEQNARVVRNAEL